MLTLPIKTCWLYDIQRGFKKEEYRDMTPYYDSRLKRYIGKIIQVKLRAGYSKTSKYGIYNVLVLIGHGRKEWGAEPDKKYYVLQILDN